MSRYHPNGDEVHVHCLTCGARMYSDCQTVQEYEQGARTRGAPCYMPSQCGYPRSRAEREETK